jgi:hypothetical protein
MSEEKTKTEEKKPEQQSLVVRSELNLEKSGVFTVSTFKGLSREIAIKEKLPTGEEINKKITVGKTGDGIETGVLTTNDFKVYLVLLDLWQKADRPITEAVNFTTLRLMKQLKLADSGSEYDQMKRWLLHLRQIPIMFKNSFFLKEKESYTTIEPFSVLSYLKIYEREYETKTGKERTRGYGAFKFADEVLQNLVNNYSHPLRLDIVRDFKKHKDTAILLYVYLDRCLAFKEKYEIGLEKLYEHIDLSQAGIRYPSDRKIRLSPILRELEGKPLSTGILSYCRTHKTEDGRDYKLIARKAQFASLPKPESKPAEERVPASPLAAKLMEKGLTESQAEEILKLQPEAAVRNQLKFLPYRLKWNEEQGKETQNPAALFYIALKENWDPPPNYLDAQEELRQRKEQAQRKEEENRQRQEQARLEFKERYRAERLMLFFEQLTPEEQEAINQKANANLSDFIKETGQTIKKDGKDPLKESLIYRSAFEPERLIIIETRRRLHRS